MLGGVHGMVGRVVPSLFVYESGDADIDAFYNSLLTGSGGDPPKAQSLEESLMCRS